MLKVSFISDPESRPNEVYLVRRISLSYNLCLKFAAVEDKNDATNLKSLFFVFGLKTKLNFFVIIMENLFDDSKHRNDIIEVLLILWKYEIGSIIFSDLIIFKIFIYRFYIVITFFFNHMKEQFSNSILLYVSPGGNQVVGLPPACNSRPGVLGRP